MVEAWQFYTVIGRFISGGKAVFTPLLAIASALAIFPTVAGAQEVSTSIVALAEGESAPFSGMLFPTETSVRWRQRIELLQERLSADIERCETVSSLRLRLVEDTLQVRMEQWGDDRAMLRESIVRASERSWYEAPALLLALGVVIGGIVVGLVAGLLAGL